MEVQALVKKLSPVKEAWIYAYLVNCWQIFSNSHARKLAT